MLVTSMPVNEEPVVGMPQPKRPEAHCKKEVPLHEERLAPKYCDALAKEPDISKGNEVDVPLGLKVVEPIAKVVLFKLMVVAASKVRVLDNSSKSKELEVTLLPAKLRVLPDQARSVPAVILVEGVS